MAGLSSFLEKLGFVQKPPLQAPMGQGMVRQSSDIIAARNAYSQYAIDKQTNGEQPVPFQNFVQGQR